MSEISFPVWCVCIWHTNTTVMHLVFRKVKQLLLILLIFTDNYPTGIKDLIQSVSARINCPLPLMKRPGGVSVSLLILEWSRSVSGRTSLLPWAGLGRRAVKPWEWLWLTLWNSAMILHLHLTHSVTLHCTERHYRHGKSEGISYNWIYPVNRITLTKNEWH